MPIPVPMSLQDGAQHAFDMIRIMTEGSSFSATAIDQESASLVYVERTGQDEEGNTIVEAAHVSEPTSDRVSLEMVGAGSPAAQTKIRRDIHARTVVRMRVTDKMENSMGNMHGGCGATLVDNLSSMSIYFHTSGELGTPWSVLGVSQNINVFYMNPCPIGSVVEIESYTVQIGKSIALLQTDIHIVEREDGESDSGSGKLFGKGWKRVRKTLSGSHTKVDNSSKAKM